MLLPSAAADGGALLQRLERMERRLSVSGGAVEPAPAVREAPVREAPVREAPVREAPVREVALQGPARAGRARVRRTGRRRTAGPVIRQRDTARPEEAPADSAQPVASIAPDDLEAFARDLRALRATADLEYP